MHLCCKIISRGSGRSACAAAAYRSGSKITDETGMIYDFTRKKGIIYSNIILPSNAPIEYKDREKLWKSVQENENLANSQLAREIEVALPRELSQEQQISLCEKYVMENFVKQGMCADYSIHNKGDGNPHCHIMLTMRPMDNEGKWINKTQKRGYALDKNGNKIPIIDPTTGKQKIGARGRKMWQREKCISRVCDWDNKGNVEKWRKSWAEFCNQYLDKNNQIDHRSYYRQGKEQIPTYHEGYAARLRFKRGQHCDIIEVNKRIKELNAQANNKLPQEMLDQLHKNMWWSIREHYRKKYRKLYEKQGMSSNEASRKGNKKAAQMATLALRSIGVDINPNQPIDDKPKVFLPVNQQGIPTGLPAGSVLGKGANTNYDKELNKELETASINISNWMQSRDTEDEYLNWDFISEFKKAELRYKQMMRDYF